MKAFIACSGCAAGKERFAGKVTGCAEAVASGFLRGECKNGCVGAGSCVTVCKQGAMSIENGKVVIDRENAMAAETVQKRVYALRDLSG